MNGTAYVIPLRMHILYKVQGCMCYYNTYNLERKMVYQLYHTFNCTSDKKSKLTKKQVDGLRDMLLGSVREDPKKMEAVVLLIIEHSRVEGVFKYNPDGGQTLPYGMKEENFQVVFELDKLPMELQHILYKFCTLGGE